MADKEENEEPATRGNDWEVVSLTASTYAAAPTPDQVGVIDGEKSGFVEGDQSETSLAMFMSGHFVFPPSQHENLPLEAETTEIDGVQESEDSVSQFIGEEGMQSDAKKLEVVNDTKGLGLGIRDEFHGVPVFDDKGSLFSVGGTGFEEGTAYQGLNMVDKEQSFYESRKFSSYTDDPTVGGLAEADDTEATETVEPNDNGSDLSISSLTEQVDKEYDDSDLPCGAWWKRRAAAFYAHAKETNTVWSIVVAAAVMGLVIIGQHWQQERWQVLQLKWQFNQNNERMGRFLAPLTRLKDVLVGGHRQVSFLRGGASTEH